MCLIYFAHVKRLREEFREKLPSSKGGLTIWKKEDLMSQPHNLSISYMDYIKEQNSQNIDFFILVFLIAGIYTFLNGQNDDPHLIKFTFKNQQIIINLLDTDDDKVMVGLTDNHFIESNVETRSEERRLGKV